MSFDFTGTETPVPIIHPPGDGKHVGVLRGRSTFKVESAQTNGAYAILEQIIRGGLNKMDEAKCSVIGGHSIRNEDILFGCAVTGKIDPRKIWRNVGARPGDVLLFTKSIGTGVLSTALKNNRISQVSLDAAIASMCQLNRAALSPALQ